MKSHDLKISIILPVKDGDIDLLKRALSSVYSQTYDDYEILLIDDGSRIGFAEKLDDLVKDDKKIRLFHIKSSGVSGARNFAVSKSEGDIITYIDSDDVISPFCFEEAVSLFTDETIDAVWGGTFYGDKKETDRCMDSYSIGNSKPLTKDELKRLSLRLKPSRIHKTRAECIGSPYRFDDNGYINRGIAARFIRKKVFDEKKAVFPQNIKMYEDTIWNLKMMDSGLNIYYVKTIWYYYLKNETSASNRFNDNVLHDIEVPLRRIRRLLDLKDPVEYRAYTRFLMDSLRYVYKCKYGNPRWKTSTGVRKKFLKHIYGRDPWTEIAKVRFFKAAEKPDKVKAALYRAGLLFLYWKLTWKTM